MSAECQQPRIEDRPSHEEARRNQLRQTCGGTRWRYVGGDCLGWWEECKGCSECASDRPVERREAA